MEVRLKGKIIIPNSVQITLSGQTSRGVKEVILDDNGNLSFVLTDGSTELLGNVMGPQGTKGDTGAKGEKGDRGEKGDTGATGAKGEKGDKGDKGDTGATGAQGEQGAQGLQGERGEKGEKGDTGAKGDPGTDGTTPTIGANGNWYLGTTDTGKPSRGAKGDKGDQGEQGIQGIRGEQGIQGERGLQGIQGEKGEKGDTGSGFKVLGYYATAAALSAAVANPEAGMAYGVGTAEPYDIYIYDSVSKSWKNNGPLQGAKGDTGVGVASVTFDDDVMTVNLTSGAHYSSGSLRGPQGVKGDAGAKGDPGAPGPQGPAGKTPVKGTDYFTAADKSEIAEDAAALVTVPSASSTTPKAPGTASAGSEDAYARGDHVHPKRTLYEAELQWGGASIKGDIAPIDSAMIPIVGYNKTECANPAGVAVEYSNDAGATWINYDASNVVKSELVSVCGKSSVVIGGPLHKQKTLDDKLRITVNARDCGTYTQLKKILIEISTNGAHNVTVYVEKAKSGDPTEFIEVGTYSIDGWTGWNSIDVRQDYFGGGGENNVCTLRFTFNIGSLNTDGYTSALEVLHILFLGTTNWTTPSNMAKTGHLYDYDTKQNATFPAKVTAKSFSGDGSNLTNIPYPVTSVNSKTGAVTVREVPAVTTADNGKFLRVVSGAWAAVEIPNANGGSF